MPIDMKNNAPHSNPAETKGSTRSPTVRTESVDNRGKTGFPPLNKEYTVYKYIDSPIDDKGVTKGACQW
ncbi:MAG: hypothetical protein JXO49_07985 [Deltaproteobacteria bacterium]|nr:hypothetical protein [Candidatus Anaeroferrophillus wilburensis]MBN2889268.1 hypothetical protein [Deltaproteobacteria bacterium]